MKSWVSIIGSVVEGTIHEDIEISNRNKRKFYVCDFENEKPKSNKPNIIQVAFGEDMKQLMTGKVVLSGTINSIQIFDGVKSVGKRIYVKAKKAEHYEENTFLNEGTIVGYVTYSTEKKETKDGHWVRNLSVFCGKGAIPCVIWGTEAQKEYQIGDKVCFKGRLKSRWIEKHKKNITEFEVTEYGHGKGNT